MPTETTDEIVLLSDEVQEIISNKPSWIIRNGITVFFILILCIVCSTFFISYPDTILAEGKLTTINAPKVIQTRTDGRIVMLKAVEGEKVKQKDILGYMESTANPTEIISLSQSMDSLQLSIENDNAEIISSYFLTPYKDLGEVQQAYQTFTQAFILFKQYLINGFYNKKKKMLQYDMVYLQKLHNNLVEQKKLTEEDVSLAKETFTANQSLKNDKIISAFDYRNEKSKYIAKELSIPQIASAIISNESSIHEKQKEVLQLENEIAQQKWIFIQAVNTLKAQLSEWKTKYLLIAPIAGRVAFAGFVQQNQQFVNNQTVCFINPENTQYYLQVTFSQTNFGKIKEDQKVLLKFPSYPYQEFGAVEGRLSFISKITTDSGYIAKVMLPYGLKTNYNKQIQYREGLVVQAEIITANLKLSDRLLFSARQLFKK